MNNCKNLDTAYKCTYNDNGKYFNGVFKGICDAKDYALEISTRKIRESYVGEEDCEKYYDKCINLQKDAVCHKDVGFCHTNDAMAIYLLMFGVLGFCLAVLTFHLGSWMSERRNKHTNLNNANVESYQDIQSIQ